MAETSDIAWTKSTFNPWIGCTKVSPGCDACYAEALDKRHKWGGATHWGAGVRRHRTSESYWKQPLRWNKLAADEKWRSNHGDFTTSFKGRPGFWPVFCASLADVFDNEVSHGWRRDLIDLIEMTPNLSWLLVTKRIGNVQDMLREARAHDWLANQRNVRIIITVVNQEEADRDIPKLLELRCKNGVSYEPALGPVNWGPYISQPTMRRCPDCNWSGTGPRGSGCPNCGNTPSDRLLEWIIVGGESYQAGHYPRPFVHGWARDTIKQCKAAGVPVFVKQMGSNAVNREGVLHPYKDRAGADPAEWSEDLRVQEFPA